MIDVRGPGFDARSCMSQPPISHPTLLSSISYCHPSIHPTPTHCRYPFMSPSTAFFHPRHPAGPEMNACPRKPQPRTRVCLATSTLRALAALRRALAGPALLSLSRSLCDHPVLSPLGLQPLPAASHRAAPPAHHPHLLLKLQLQQTPCLLLRNDPQRPHRALRPFSPRCERLPASP